MTQSEIVNNIITIAYHATTDDIDLPFRQVAFWVDTYRARLIKEFYEKRKYIDSNYIQDAGCIELECRNLNDCCNLDINMPVLRSKKQIPQFLDLPFGHAYTNISLIDKLTPISIYDPSNIYWTKYSRYTKHTRKAFFIDNYLYLTNNTDKDMIRFVNLRGLFQSPEDLKDFKKCNTDAPCFDENSTYPIPGYMVQILNEMILNKELKFNISTLQLNDNTNDSSENNRQSGIAR